LQLSLKEIHGKFLRRSLFLLLLQDTTFHSASSPDSTMHCVLSLIFQYITFLRPSTCPLTQNPLLPGDTSSTGLFANVSGSSNWITWMLFVYVKILKRLLGSWHMTANVRKNWVRPRKNRHRTHGLRYPNIF